MFVLVGGESLRDGCRDPKLGISSVLGLSPRLKHWQTYSCSAFSSLNTYTGTVSISLADHPVYLRQAVKTCLLENKLVESLTLSNLSNPSSANIGNDNLATMLNTVAPQPAVLCVPNLVTVAQTGLHNHVSQWWWLPIVFNRNLSTTSSSLM